MMVISSGTFITAFSLVLLIWNNGVAAAAAVAAARENNKRINQRCIVAKW